MNSSPYEQSNFIQIRLQKCEIYTSYLAANHRSKSLVIEAAPRQCGERWQQSISRASRVFAATSCSCHEGFDRSSLCDTETPKHGWSNTWQQLWEHTEGHYKLGEAPNNLRCCKGFCRQRNNTKIISFIEYTNCKRTFITNDFFSLDGEFVVLV